jgi:hypothetical protein
MNQHVPFTYLVGWKEINQWYYGARYAQGCHPDDLWVTYFTSSSYVKELREKHGEPDVIQIRRTFTSAEDALRWETTVLRRVLGKSSQWINQKKNMWPLVNPRPHSEETKRKISEAKKGKPLGPFSEEHRRKMSIASQNRSEEYRQKMSIAKKGKKWATNGKVSKLVTDLPDSSWWWGRKRSTSKFPI